MADESMEPESLSEWIDYVNTFEDDDMIVKMEAMNQMPFIEMLQEEGIDMNGINLLFYNLAMRFVDLDMAIPKRGPDQFMSLQALVARYEEYDLPTTVEEIEGQEEAD